MRIILQRVAQAAVSIAGKPHAAIGPGLLIFVGVETNDSAEDATWLTTKIARMRIFADSAGKMNLSLLETTGEALVVSQFTLHAATKKGTRPSFLRAAQPPISQPLFEAFCAALAGEIGKPVARGVFGADMQISLVNDGPVTIIIDSKNRE